MLSPRKLLDSYPYWQVCHFCKEEAITRKFCTVLVDTEGNINENRYTCPDCDLNLWK